MKILLFTKKSTDKKTDIPESVLSRGLEVEYISFDSNNLEDLLKIARFRIINFPTSLIISDHGKVLLKVKGSIPNSYVDKFIN